MNLYYDYSSSDEGGTYVKFAFYCDSYTEDSEPKNVDNKPVDLADLVFKNYKEKYPNQYYLNPNFNVFELNEERLAQIYQKEIQNNEIAWDGVSEIEYDIDIYEEGDRHVYIDLFNNYISLNIESKQSDTQFAKEQLSKVLDNLFQINPYLVDIITEKVVEFIESGDDSEDLSIELTPGWYNDIDLTVRNKSWNSSYEIYIG